MDAQIFLGLALLASALALRAVFDLSHRRPVEQLLRWARLSPDTSAHRGSYHRPVDAALCVLPFAWCWLDIHGATLISVGWGHAAGFVLLAVFVGGRIRALQEIGHNAVHGALCRSRRWQWLLSDLFFQFPTFKRDMHSRFITHVKEHHQNPNQPLKDPNLMRIIAGGMVPGISPARFYLNLFYPLLPRGFWVGIRTLVQHSVFCNRGWRTAVLRVLAVSATLFTFLTLTGWKGLVWGYVVPLFTTYALFTWWSLLSEHRWFVACDVTDRRTLECTNCRPMDFPRPHGWLIRQLVYPLSDRYHLAHSLYPFMRWNHLPAIDRHLVQHDEAYARHRSEGFLFASTARPAALSELRERLTGEGEADLAGWSAQYARAPGRKKIELGRRGATRVALGANAHTRRHR